MRILCVCDHGSNRSVHIADQLRYRGHETIPVGAHETSDDTRVMLADWCELAIFTGAGQRDRFPDSLHAVYWLLPEKPAGDVGSVGLRPTGHRLLGAAVDAADGGGLIISGRLSVQSQPCTAISVPLARVAPRCC